MSDARTVIAEGLKDLGCDFLGCTRDDVALAILAALAEAGFVVLKNRECPDCGHPDGWGEHPCA